MSPLSCRHLHPSKYARGIIAARDTYSQLNPTIFSHTIRSPSSAGYITFFTLLPQVKRIASLEYGQWDELDELVTNWAQVANQALVQVLLTRYKLQQHLHAIKQYLLFGQVSPSFSLPPASS
jgi:hypothetical protein